MLRFFVNPCAGGSRGGRSLVLTAKGRLPHSRRHVQQRHCPVIYNRCAGCHRADGVAPFRLVTYAEVKQQRR
jgi:hypothetical protein